MRRRIPLVISLLMVIASKGFADSGYANQRFIDNALQFDSEEGVRTHVEQVDPKATDSLVLIEVSSSNSDIQPQRKPKKVSVGLSFSDMASDVQVSKKTSAGTTSGASSGSSFGDLAKAARGGKPKEAVIVPTKNIGAIQRLFPTATPAASQNNKPVKPQVPAPKKAHWQSYEP